MFFSLFLSVFLALSYVFLFYLSSDTPIKFSLLLERIELFGLILCVSVLVAGSLNVLLIAFEKLAKLEKTIIVKVVFSCVFVLLFFCFLLLAENWSYSLFGFGLKTSAAWWSKLLFFIAAAFLSYQFTPVIIRVGKFLSSKKAVVTSFLAIAIILYAVPSLMRIVSNLDNEEYYGDISSRLNVIILVSDGVNASEMSVYGSKFDTTPFMQSIRSEFMVFENAYTNNQNSTGSVVSLLAGVSPLTTKVVYPPDILTDENSRRSLPRALGQFSYYRSLWGIPHYVDADSQNMVDAFDTNNELNRDFSTKLNESHKLDVFALLEGELALPSLQTWYLRSMISDYSGVISDVLFINELDNPFSQVVEEESKQTKQRPRLNDDQRIEKLLQDIDNAANTGTPLFSYTHLMKTHGSKFNPKTRVFSVGRPEKEPWDLDFYRDAILDFDAKFSEVYEKLKHTNQLDNTLLIVTSDHGMAWNNQKRIPLLVRLPHAEKTGTYNVNVQLIDIAPTALAALGLNIPDWMEGQSLINPNNIAPDRFILSAGVFDNHFSDGVWVRDTKPGSDFVTGLKFSLIHCDYFMKSAFPIDFTPALLPDRQGPSNCNPLNVDELKAEAESLVNSKLDK